jgi:hypothetical protein
MNEDPLGSAKRELLNIIYMYIECIEKGMEEVFGYQHFQ